jgi:hypothetical protein
VDTHESLETIINVDVAAGTSQFNRTLVVYSINLMSGKRQHFIPRFLQSGFASHTNGDEIFTWVYRKNTQPYNTNIANTGVEGHFYSQNDDYQADDNITSAEGDFCELVYALRNGSEEAIADSSALAELIAHLEIRTRHLRQSFSNTSGAVMEEMLRFMDDQQAFGDFMKRRLINDPSIMRDAITDEFRKRNLPDSLLPQLLDASLSPPFLEQILSSSLADLPLMIDQFRLELPHLLKNGSKTGHIKALKQTLSPQFKIDQYRTLNFFLSRSTKIMFPLGDAPIIFRLNGDRPFKTFSEKNDLIQSVYLPLTPSLILVGRIDEDMPELSQIPIAIAQCSLEYFISDSQSTANDALHPHIGKNAHLLTEDQIKNLITEMINE